ncbi:AraC family transcriptional regulator [Pseudomonas fluorescens]|uniref:AraC family transcriptional regulator n=1 Tax=Pseudomonas fluorescens TaxID=294 RepID=A0A944DIV9_PSEFL|nr:AraC family transcriptional regulator [Pseudomonas fluorescens]MBT2298181.1 AraC family transcriptional regulator [Pseudomonas fluorescens]MBT2309696.1 AraC family transcriptional regulator [Pseudomonas fluorescens]MBT2314859.1 AraC family transcriptional regulator [Pseudomonas fluorescens]MBT2327765.1 AraC family transcriptional regulator [Pseudomonas fluorescens]MBT2345512.1 AraC family transcriptional regulator [Pseudomonas fluorescens]
MTSGSFSQFGVSHAHSLSEGEPAQPNERLHALRKLIEKVTSQIGLNEVCSTSIPGLTFYRMANLGTPTYCVYEPCVAIILQGAKEITFGEEVCEFGQGVFFVTSVDIPTLARVTAANEQTPYLSVVLKLDLSMLNEVIQALEPPKQERASEARGFASGTASGEILDAFARLAALIERPLEADLMSDLIKREICIRLLLSGAGQWLRSVTRDGYRNKGVVRVIEWLKHHYDEPLHVADLAERSGMASSTLHHNFRKLTGTSPVQYQKSLRLQAARSLMLTERIDVNTAALRVGYESVAQFSREYTRRFGAPPSKDIKHARENGGRLD